jgi:serine/threonine-protein kinase RsbW
MSMNLNNITNDAHVINDIEIHIPSDLVFERVVRESAVVVAKHLGFVEERIADLQLAVSEAVTNAIEHGNQCNTSIKVGVKFIISQDKLAVQVTDKGQWESALGAMDNIPDKWNLEERLEQDLTRGMGFFLIQNLADNTELRASEEGGTQFTMWFNIQKGKNNSQNVNIEMEGPEPIY